MSPRRRGRGRRGGRSEPVPEVADKRINDRIKALKVRVVGPDGEALGVFSLQAAIELATDTYGVDLVEVAPDADPPVCRVMDYSKYRYQEQIRLKEARRRQASTSLKELQLGPKTGDHDYEVRRRQLEKFLSQGHRVRVSVFYRRRWELAHPELGRQLLQRLADDIADFGKVDSPVKQEGRNFSMVVVPVARSGSKHGAAAASG